MSPKNQIPHVSTSLSWKVRLDHFTARLGIRRSSHRVLPGLYAVGHPQEDSPVFVSANYTLSFDSLRSSLAGLDCYILVLDTKGINVWCAAGKGTFSTEELVHRIEEAGLKDIVRHRDLILPQLGATGVAAHEVRKRSGFKVIYGPVRSQDIGEYMKNGQATEEMREVRFGLRDRMVLVPVELAHILMPTMIAAVLGYLAGGFFIAAGVVASILAGVILLPMLLPWIPTPNFSTKGYVLGGILSLPFLYPLLIADLSKADWYYGVGRALGLVLIMMAVTGYLSLNFTGSTTFASKSGVKMEFKLYVPFMIGMGGIGIVLISSLKLIQYFRG